MVMHCVCLSSCDILLNMINKVDVYAELKFYMWKSLFLPL